MGTNPAGNGTFRPSKALIAVGFLQLLRERSTCKRLQVAALVCDSAFKVIHAMGYNGPAAGEANDACRDEKGNCGCVHAEANALVKLRTSERGCYMFCTTSPCEACAKLIVNSGAISQVLYLEDYRSMLGKRIIVAAGLKLTQLVPRHDAATHHKFVHDFSELDLIIEENVLK